MANTTEIWVERCYLPAIKKIVNERITEEIAKFRDERLNSLLVELAADIASRIQISTEQFQDRIGERIVVTVRLIDSPK